MGARWEHYPHEADLGVRGFGATPAEAFEQAALALTSVVCDLRDVRPLQSSSVHCRAPDLELLFAEWLNAVIYEMSAGKMLFCRFRVELGQGDLAAELWGEPVDRARHRPAVEPKGATYTTLRVARQGEEWVAQTVIDV